MLKTSLALFSLFLAASATAAETAAAAYDQPYQEKALEIYRYSISLRTAAGHGNVPELAEYLARQFRDAGFAADDVHVLPFTVAVGGAEGEGDAEETSSLVVRYRGDGSSGKKPILLLAHMDVVDALPEDWERDPFTLIEEDGYFFGRGTLDNKFGTTMLTATFLRLKAEAFVPTRDLIIAFTGDEETGMITTRGLVTTHRELTDAEFVLNADAGGGELDKGGAAVSYLLQAAEKTYATFELTIRNPGGHSSTPRSDNAIYELADVLRRLSEYRFPVRSNGITTKFFAESAKVTKGPVGDAMRRFAEDPNDTKAADVLYDQPGLVGVTRTTCVATMLRAGHAENALPQRATATVNCRIFPGIEVAEIEERLMQVANNDALQIEVLAEPLASPASELRSDLGEALSQAVHAAHPDVPIIPYMAPYATDGKETRRAGLPTYGVMGLFMEPSEIFAHGLNERVPVASFFAGLEHWHRLLTALAGH